MTETIRLDEDVLAAISVPEGLAGSGGAHLCVRHLRGIKAEPVMDLSSGQLVGHEYLSLLPAGVSAEAFFECQSATALTELFLLQLYLSQGRRRCRRFINLPVRVLLRDGLCDVLCHQDLRGVVVEIQDVEALDNTALSGMKSLRRNLSRLTASGAEIYADDVSPLRAGDLRYLNLPLSGVKISRQDFLAYFIHGGTGVSVREYGRLAPQVVIEGIETPEQHLIAAMSGASSGQGYLWPAEAGYFN